ncbi:unnamed protein product [Caenorhabditis brenneri]
MKVLLLLVSLAVGLCFGDQVRSKRQALSDALRWPNNTMTYYYEDGFPLEMQAMFRDAFNYLKSHTCLNFVNNRDAENAVYIRNSVSCWSALGMRSGEHQELSLDYPCAHFGVALHETMHALGIAHGQARTDRDKYLIVEAEDHNDYIKDDTILSVPFDYGSVMLYWRTERRFPKNPEYNYTMGSLRVGFYDMILLNQYYKCNCEKHPVKLDCKNGGYQNPANCDECTCTDGFKGRTCDELDGHVLSASTEWKPLYYGGPLSKTLEKSMAPKNVFFHVTAPEGSTIEVRTTRLEGFFCHYTCDWNGVELKYLTDRRMTSPLTCCDDDNLWNKTRSSTNNPFVIVKYGEDKGPRFQFEYRYLPGNLTSS